jgi:hypothetical protein
LDLPPRNDEIIKFSSDFGRRFAIFVDTEEEFDWTIPQSRDSVATSHVRHIPEFQRLADGHGVQPCYLIDFPVAQSVDAQQILGSYRESGQATIGSQLHTWVTPPFEEELTVRNSFVGNLEPSLERAKTIELTNQIERGFGARPISFRSGRYGIGPYSGALLEELGYRLDTSVRPHFDYSYEGGPSFLRHTVRPYWAGPNGLLMELPLSVSFTGKLRPFGKLLFGNGRNRQKFRSALSRMGLLARVAITPEDMPEADVRDAIRALLDDGMNFLSISFHSPSLAPGHTPYVRSSADLSDFYRWWDKIFNFIAQQGVTPVGLDEIIEDAWKSRTVAASA